MTWSRTGAVVLGIIVGLARPAVGQQLRLMQAGVQTAGDKSVADGLPSGLSLTAKAVGWSAFGSVLGGVAGSMVDQAYCQERHGDEKTFLFGPCFLYASGGTAAGWFGGAIVGSTLGAARVAKKRGCPRRLALLRAAIGATIGAAPGLSIVARRSGDYPPSRSIVIATTPLLSGIGAAAAVAGCHAA